MFCIVPWVSCLQWRA